MADTVTDLPKKRLYIGGTVFVVGLLSPILVPLVAMTGLSTAWKATLSGLLLLGIPELFMLVAVVILGKAGSEYLKRVLFGFLKRHVIPETVGATRYCIGLIAFFSPIFWGWLAPYFSEFVPIQEYNLTIAVAGDLFLLTGLVLLGGEFWDKLRSLFFHRAGVNWRDAN
jgi:hypothetical protein